MARLLLIDDDQLVLNTVANQLERSGYTIEKTTNARKGLELAEQEPFDLIVLDIMMPDVDGIEFITELRRAGIATPIIAMTGGMSSVFENDHEASINRYLDYAGKLGADVVLRKPFTQQQILDCVGQCIAGGQTRAASL